MKSFSIEEAYLWVQRFVAREWRLVLPVALAFMVLPPLILDVFWPNSASILSDPAAVQRDPAAAMRALAVLAPLQIVIFLFSAAGGLAITALALAPGISVAEALAMAGRRLWVLVGAMLLIVAAEAGIVTTVMIALVVTGVPLLTVQSFTIGVLFGMGLFIGVRIVPLVPMVVRRRIGPVSALRESWMMTAGAFWRIFGAIAVYLVGSIVVLMALTTAIGAVMLLLGKMMGSPELAAVLGAVISRVLAAMIGTGFYLLAAAIYRQLDAPSRGI